MPGLQFPPRHHGYVWFITRLLIAWPQGELARLKREAAARRAAAAAQQVAQPAAAMAPPRAAVPTADAPPRITEDMLRTLKVSWSVKVRCTDHRESDRHNMPFWMRRCASQETCCGD